MKKYIFLRIFLMILPLLTIFLFSYEAGSTGNWDFNPGTTCNDLNCGATDPTATPILVPSLP